MEIYVKTVERPFWDSGQVTVVDNGFCNHANTEEEESYFENSCGDPGLDHKEQIIVCRTCFAWRYANDDMKNGWHDETILETEPIKTTAQLVLRYGEM